MAKKKQAGNLDELAQRLANEEDEDSKIARMIRSMPKWRFYLLAAISIFWLLFQLRIKLYKPFEPWFQLPLHLCLALYVVFLMNPLADKYKKNWLWIVDGALILFPISVSSFIPISSFESARQALSFAFYDRRVTPARSPLS